MNETNPDAVMHISRDDPGQNRVPTGLCGEPITPGLRRQTPVCPECHRLADSTNGSGADPKETLND